MSTHNTYDCVIIGAGITGLSAAFYLKEKYKNLALIDGGRKGGVIQTVIQDGFTLECGPNVVALKPALLKLIGDLGLKEKIKYPAIENFKQMVFHKNKAAAVPKGPGAFLSTALISTADKLRILKNVFSSKFKNSVASDMPVSDFFAGIFGEEVVKNILDPVLLGIYGGDVSKLSAKSVFPKLYEKVLSGQSFIKAAKGPGRPKLAVLQGGMQCLTDNLWHNLDGALTFRNLNVTAISREGDLYALQLSDGSTINTTKVVICTSGKMTAKYISGIDASLSEKLAYIQAASLVVVHAAVSELPLEFHKSFGVLFPSSLNTPLLGVMFNSRLFPHLSPAGKDLLTICLGGMHHPDFVRNEEKLIYDFVKSELKSKLKIPGLEFLKISRWENVIPQYNTGHFEIVEAMRLLEKTNQGLHFCGADTGGVGVPDRVQSAIF